MSDRCPAMVQLAGASTMTCHSEAGHRGRHYDWDWGQFWSREDYEAPTEQPTPLTTTPRGVLAVQTGAKTPRNAEKRKPMDTEGPWRPNHYRLTPLDKSPDETVQQVYTVARSIKGLTAELNMHQQLTFPIPNLHHILTITVDGQPGVWMELGAIRDLDEQGVPRHWRHHLTYNYGTGRTSTLATHRRIQDVFDFMERAARRGQ